jgi:hypothetical protein
MNNFHNKKFINNYNIYFIMAEKPTAAFVLSLIGGIFILVGAIFLLVIAIPFLLGQVPEVEEPIGFFAFLGSLLAVGSIIGVISGILIIIGAIMINSGERGKVRNGGILVLIFSIISLILSGGGFFIGFLLGLIGGILALSWKPEEVPTQPITAAPPPPS